MWNVGFVVSCKFYSNVESIGKSGVGEGAVGTVVVYSIGVNDKGGLVRFYVYNGVGPVVVFVIDTKV